MNNIETTVAQSFSDNLKDFFEAMHYRPGPPMPYQRDILIGYNFDLQLPPNIAWLRTIKNALVRFLPKQGFTLDYLNNESVMAQKDDLIAIITITASNYSNPKVGLAIMKKKES